VNIPNGKSTVTLNLNIPVGNGLMLGCAPTANLYRNSSGADYTNAVYSIPGVISIIDNDVSAGGYYYFFYDWRLQLSPCITARTPYTINVNDNAAFTFTTSNLTANFTDGSASPTSWHWDFGDGSTSTQQNPSHTYNTNGTYTVTLIVQSSGCTD